MRDDDKQQREILEAALNYIKHIGANHTMRGEPHPQQWIVDGLERVLSAPSHEAPPATGETPRTDAMDFIESDCGGTQPFKKYMDEDQVRQLERELAEARREIQKICQQQADADSAQPSARAPKGWRLVPAEATVEWSGRMKAGGFSGTNFQAQQYITQVLRAAPSAASDGGTNG